MTTIVYHGRVLAADTRITHANKKMKCKKCGEMHPAVSDDGCKIQNDFGPRAKFRNEKVIAVAMSGVVSPAEKAIKLLTHEIGLETIYKSHWLILDHAHRAFFPRFTLIIVTEKNVYRFAATSKGVEVTEIGYDGTAVAGTGGNYAEAMIKVVGATTIDAIKVATYLDDGSGGDIKFLDIDEPDEIHDAPVEVDKEKRIEEFKQTYGLKHTWQPNLEARAKAIKNTSAAVAKKVAAKKITR